MAMDLMILMQENPFRSPLFWAQMALASLVAFSGPKKVSIFRAIPSSGPRNGFSRIKIKSLRPAPYKQQVH
jgi:hypothetical protein